MGAREQVHRLATSNLVQLRAHLEVAAGKALRTLLCHLIHHPVQPVQAVHLHQVRHLRQQYELKNALHELDTVSNSACAEHLASGYFFNWRLHRMAAASLASRAADVWS